MTFDQALSTILKRVDPFWEGRIHSMLVASCICKRGSFPAEITGIRVNPDWPRKGSITLTRGDGNRVRLYMTKRDGFKISIKNNITNFVEDKSSATYIDCIGSIFDGCQDISVSHWRSFTMITKWEGVDSRGGKVTHPGLGEVATLTAIRYPNGVTGLAWRSTHPVSQNWDICSDYLINERELAQQAQEEYEAERSLQKDRSAFAALKRGYKGTHLSAYLKRVGREDLLYLV